MESLGQQLRSARLRLGLTLDDISAKTRINCKCIQAIETDDVGQISSAFFYKSFVRQIARTVGLDHTSLTVEIQKAAACFPEPLMPGQAGAPVRPDVPGLRPQRTRKLRWLVSVGSLVLLLVVCSNMYDAWQKSRLRPQGSGQGRVEPDDRPLSNQLSSNGQAKTGESQPPLQEEQPASPVIDSVRVELSALESTWLSVAADGKQVFSGTLQASETKTLEGRQTARVRTGNAGGVEVIFNGRTIGRLGREGEVRTVVFTKDGYNFTEAHEHVARLFSWSGE